MGSAPNGLLVSRNRATVTITGSRTKLKQLTRAEIRMLVRDQVSAPSGADVEMLTSSTDGDNFEGVFTVSWNAPAGDRFAKI